VKAKWIKRGLRIAAFMAAAGILAPGAGNWFGVDAMASAAFGAVLVGTGLIASLLLIFAARGEISDDAFNKTIAEQIEQLENKDRKK